MLLAATEEKPCAFFLLLKSQPLNCGQELGLRCSFEADETWELKGAGSLAAGRWSPGRTG